MNRVGAVLIGIILCMPLLAQEQMERQRPPLVGEHQEQFVFYQAINLLADDSTLSRVDIPYRIDHQFFVAIKNNDPALPFPFKRRGELLVELLDENHISKARDINRFVIGAEDPDTQPGKKAWYEGVASFTVPPGKYTIVFDLSDLESARTFLEQNKKVAAKKFHTSALETSTPMFVQPLAADSLTLINFGGNILFGTDASLFVQLASTRLTDDPVQVKYKIETQAFSFQESRQTIVDTTVQSPFIEACRPTKTTFPTVYQLTPFEGISHTGAILVPLHSSRFPLRPFTMTLTLKQGALESSVEWTFQMVWPEMPLSLRDIDFALEALRHITTEAELDSLKRGTRETRLRHLEEFWRAKDKTPATAFNEMMVEYYRRVDYTMQAFSSMRGGDGYKSDRGRIYILYGPPTTTERSLDPAAGYQEIWVYEKLGKKFVFVDQSKSGNYTLAATQNLQ